MWKPQIDNNHVVIVLIIVLSALSRLLPHPPNFTPMTAIALFTGFYATNKVLIYGLPIAIMLLSDLFLGLSIISIFVYLSFLLISFLGTLSKKPKVPRLLANVLLSSISFFIISNFGVWTLGGYPKTLSGMASCYTMAIPFFKNSLIGDFFYSGVMALCYYLSRISLLNPI